MTFTILDVILIIVVTGFVAFGYALGFIHTLGALVGIILGTWLAGIFYEPLSHFISGVLLGNENLARIISFILVFTIANRLVGIGFWVIGKIFNVISIIPFTKTLNRVLGGVVGFFEAIFALGIFLFVAARLPFAEWFTLQLKDSAVAPWLVKVSVWLTGLLPDILRHLSSFI